VGSLHRLLAQMRTQLLPPLPVSIERVHLVIGDAAAEAAERAERASPGTCFVPLSNAFGLEELVGVLGARLGKRRGPASRSQSSR